MLYFDESQTILFMGDSITDCGRDRENPECLGAGYAKMTGGSLAMSIAELKPRILNLGISGNRVRDLKARWKEDVLEYKPDILSILIGINDVWRRYDSNDPTPTDKFLADYHEILKLTKQQIDCQLIILEPFVLPSPDDRKAWREDLDPKIAGIRQLAIEFKAVYVPLDGIFAAACCRQQPAFWAHDGVHPSPAGHSLISNAWLDAAGI